jgi:hypothetical protein
MAGLEAGSAPAPLIPSWLRQAYRKDMIETNGNRECLIAVRQVIPTAI